ncbi:MULTISPECIES: ABC transporter substrate-binding protein [unclassified Rhizobium]|uniref:ABC transporter substrate-binding protein n=1 Tax=unclassified Rhizobium TaxID=2613769 RepID=UPI001ADA4B8F|nr:MULTISPECIES: ABC transporter substrate-binding protein [unclassified Rhizobium]MBO9123976.1 ABC transporter substrate-binding protein [Rhizobium sp. 16-488-2b]MBO9174508.1 ABC transporter substrate-binding protein [Rhizobium sp. 16-488-2a]
MRKKMKRLAVPLLGLTLLCASFAGQASAAESEKVRVRLAWVAGGVDAPMFVAAAKGYFSEKGLDVDIVDGNGSTGTIQAVGSGDFEIGIAGLGALAQAQQGSGADTLIAVAGLLQKDPTSVISLKGSGITTPKDIEGKRLGTDAGNFEDGMIKAFAEANGVDMNKVKVIMINGNGDRVALLKGDVDFINGWANPDGDKVAERSAIEPPMLFADYGVNILGSSVIVRKDYLAKHGDTVRNFLAALQKGKAAAAADPDGALKILMDARPDSKEEGIKAEIANMPKYEHTKASEGKPYGWIAPEDVTLTISLLEKYSGMAPGLTPAKIYDGSYLPAN